MEMWVRALMCERSVDFGAGSGVQTARAGAGSKLWLNLGHRDSPEQKQAEAQVTEGVRGGGRGEG